MGTPFDTNYQLEMGIRWALHGFTMGISYAYTKHEHGISNQENCRFNVFIYVSDYLDVNVRKVVTSTTWKKSQQVGEGVVFSNKMDGSNNNSGCFNRF